MSRHLMNYDGEVCCHDRLIPLRLDRTSSRIFLHFGGIVRSRATQFTYRFWNDHYKIEREGKGRISRLISLGSTGSDDPRGSALRTHGV